jgi:polyhydroxyalkanoate synthesis regulator phasin
LEREKNRNRIAPSIGVSALSSELLLDECNRERRQLTEKIYELRRDIEKMKSGSLSDIELKSCRDRVEELRNRNAQLEN